MRVAISTVFLVVGSLLAASCTTDSNSTTTAAPVSAPTSTTTTTPASATTTLTTTANGTDPEVDVPSGAGVLITYDDSLSIRLPGGDSFTLPGDFEVPLALAFDDLNGGIVFQYRTGPTSLDDPIFHLRADTSEPVALITPDEGHQLKLLDVDIYDERLVAMYIDRAADGSQTLTVIGLDGGLPRQLVAGRAFLSGSLAVDHYAFTQQSVGCRIGVIADTAGEVTTRLPCPDGGPGLTLGGSAAAWVGPEGIQISDIDGDPLDVPWPVDDRATAQLFDFDGTAATTRASTTAFRYLAPDGSSSTFETSRRVVAVTLLRAPVAVAASASLGGISGPNDQCSGSGFPAVPTPLDGLTLAATETRAAVVSAANACDYLGLEILADPAMDVPADRDLARYWISREQQRFDDLSVMIRILDLPFAQGTAASGEPVFIWPAAAASPSPTEADWQALGAVYNEEDIEKMRQEGRYGGVVMTISLDGRWLSAGIPPE